MDQMALCPYETKIVLMHLHISTCVSLSRERESDAHLLFFSFLQLNGNTIFICNS